MSKSRKDQRFDGGASARKDFRGAGRQIDPRKMAQLCAQIRQTLEIALLGEVQDEDLIDLEVATVEPMADPGRVLVTFVAHGKDADRNHLMARIEAARGILTSEVAQAIHRKKVPDLVFELRRPETPS